MGQNTFTYRTCKGSQYGKVRFQITSDDPLTEKQIDSICRAAFSKPVYWNDLECYHFIMSFKIDRFWVDSAIIEYAPNEWHLRVTSLT